MKLWQSRWEYLIGVRVLVVVLLLAAACLASHKYNYRFTYISAPRALFQCYNGQKPFVQELGNVLVLECSE